MLIAIANIKDHTWVVGFTKYFNIRRSGKKREENAIHCFYYNLIITINEHKLTSMDTN